MKIEYIVGDLRFSSMAEAEEYEKELEKRKKEKEKFSAKRAERAKEVQDAWVAYVRLKGQFERDYGSSLDEFMKYIFD